MKYIRTENGIYEIVDFDNECLIPSPIIKNGRGELSHCSNYKQYNQADTIEELCDIFYWDCEDGFNIHNFMNYPIAKDTWDEYVSDCLIDEEKIEANMYGCIKTSKGLIYVAKMKDNGELVLI